MSRSLSDLMKHAFDHPASSPHWYFSAGAAAWEPAPAEDALLVAEGFENAARLLPHYSDEQVANGLKYIVDPSCGNILAGIFAGELPSSSEARLIRSFVTLFDSYLAKRCTPSLSSLNEGGQPLNLVCYMWWDVLPWYGRPNEARFKHRDDAMLDAMEATLSIPHDACREAALHGLGHWQRHYPGRVEKIINAFVQKNPGIRPELGRYAQSALAGCVN